MLGGDRSDDVGALFKQHSAVVYRRALRLLGTRMFTSGIAELRYAPDQPGGTAA